MIALGAHWEFVAAAYIGTAVVVLGIIVWAAWSSRSAKARLAALEAVGGRRRAAK